MEHTRMESKRRGSGEKIEKVGAARATFIKTKKTYWKTGKTLCTSLHSGVLKNERAVKEVSMLIKKNK